MALQIFHLGRPLESSGALWAILFFLVWGIGLGGLIWYVATTPELLAELEQGGTVGTLRGDVLGVSR
jgi:hypothetical protein